MKENRELVFITAYYLSKFDKVAYHSLGFETQKQTHETIGKILKVNPNTLKNRRDDFDAIHNNSRVGWYQRPLSPSMGRIASKFDHLSEIELRTIIKDIIKDNVFIKSKEGKILLETISEVEEHNSQKRFPINRVQTGITAEKLFQNEYVIKKYPLAGNLIDTRFQGCGYDFRIETPSTEVYIEIKGIQEMYGGVLFTGKEWEEANIKAEDYFLVIVSNIKDQPIISYIQNPSKLLNPDEIIELIPKVSWVIGKSQIKHVIQET